jgi:hypothetical protein
MRRYEALEAPAHERTNCHTTSVFFALSPTR